MLRFLARPLNAARNVAIPRVTAVKPLTRSMSAKAESEEEFDERFVKYFSRPDIDHWEIRKAMNDLAGEFFHSSISSFRHIDPQF